MFIHCSTLGLQDFSVISTTDLPYALFSINMYTYLKQQTDNNTIFQLHSDKTTARNVTEKITFFFPHVFKVRAFTSEFLTCKPLISVPTLN
jgi:hypothetical protein